VSGENARVVFVFVLDTTIHYSRISLVNPAGLYVYRNECKRAIMRPRLGSNVLSAVMISINIWYLWHQ